MGKGDKKSRRGKVNNGSYGKTRMRKESTPLYDKTDVAAPKNAEAEKQKAPAKKTPEPKAAKAQVAEPKATAERSDKEVNAETSANIKH